MKNHRYLVNILHILVVSVLLLMGIVVRTFSPATVFPKISIPMLVLLSLVPMVIEQRVGGGRQRKWSVSTVVGGVTFTVLPWCAGWNPGMPVWKLWIAATVVFGVTDRIYGSIVHKLSSGSRGRFAPEANALMLYLASQCLQGLI